MSRKLSSLILVTLLTFACASREFGETAVAQNTTSQKFVVGKDLIDGKSTNWISHTGNGAFDNYLAMNLPFPPAKKLYEDLETALGFKIKNRGESHITVITPPEYDGALKKHVTIQEINKIAENKIQKAGVTQVCLGKGEIKEGNKTISTYYVVVDSPELVALRKEVETLFVSRGGDKNAFKAENFYPHITIGFTKRDLHESDGIIKDKKSCFASIELK